MIRFDVQGIIDLIQAKAMSIFTLLDEECRMPKAGGKRPEVFFVILLFNLLAMSVSCSCFNSRGCCINAFKWLPLFQLYKKKRMVCASYW